MDSQQKASPDRNDEAFAGSPWRPCLETAAVAACGAIFACAYPPFEWGALAWVGLIPLFWMARRRTVFAAFRLGFAWGYAWSLCAFFWLREISFPIPFVMAAVLACFPALWAMLIPALWRNLLLPAAVRLRGSDAVRGFYSYNPLMEVLFALAIASWWCCLEWVRTWIFTGLPWNFLATAQWRNNAIIQICEFTGVYGVSFVIAMTNISAALAIEGFRKGIPEGRYKRPFPLILSVLIIMTSVTAGWKSLALRNHEFMNADGLRVGVVQCDMSQRRNASGDQAAEALDVCIALSKKLLDTPDLEYGGRPLDLIVWPETAVPYPLRGSSSFCIDYRFRLSKLIDDVKVPFLIGSIDFGDKLPDGQYEIFNSALFVDRKAQVADRYAKEHIVPFGEFVPLGETFPKLNELVGMGRNLTPGRRFNPIEVAPGAKAGVSICYEDVFPYISRRHAMNGANFLLVITNDAWYPKSSEPDQHFANCVFRAVENRLPMLRCGNSNYSCLVGPDGRILDSIFKRPDGKGGLMPDPAHKGREAGRFTIPIPSRHRPTFYSIHGDVFIIPCWLIVAIASILALLNWRQYKKALLAPFEQK